MSMKQEAIKLLELDNLDVMQAGHLDWLTISQADPTFKAGAIPRYTTSIDACESLPLLPGYRWTLISPVSGSEYIVAYASIDRGAPTRVTKMPRGTTLPLAMLLAWWLLQQD